jgi:hypothetical protein
VGEEFRVNEVNIPGTNAAPGGSIELNPTAAMDSAGNFVVAWDQVTQQNDGVALDTLVVARLFDRFGKPNATTPNTFRVDVGDDNFASDPEHTPKERAVGGNVWQRAARNPQAAMDSEGNFIITWEAWQDNDNDDSPGSDSYGVYFRRFQPDGTPDPTMADSAHQANLVITIDDDALPDVQARSEAFAFGQVNPSVGMDADGDYAVVWNGNGAVPHPTDPAGLDVTRRDTEGVWIRNFHADDGAGGAEFVTVQSRVNMTSAGIQQFPSIGMEPDGDKIVVWNGWGVGDTMGIFARRYDERTDTAGPMATELRLNDDAHTLVTDGLHVADNADGNRLDEIVVVFDEDMTRDGPFGVENHDNWTLVNGYGEVLEGQISNIEFDFNPATNKWEALISFRGDGLPTGYYELTASEELEDVMGNKLRKTGLLPGSRSDELDDDLSDRIRRTTLSFTVGAMPVPGDGFTGTPTTGVEFLVNQIDSASHVQTLATPFETGSAEEQSNRTVAVDHDGDFVVVWTSYGQDGDGAGVYMRLFNRDNEPLTDEVQVNTITDGDQRNANVAIDADGEFVVVWESEGHGPDGSRDVFARRFSSVGDPLDEEQWRVNTQTVKDQDNPAVAMSSAGLFVVVWETEGQTFGYFNDIHGQLFTFYDEDESDDVYTGFVGDEFLVNDADVAGTLGTELNPAIAMDPAGNFVVAWDEVVLQADGVILDTQVFGRLFDSSAAAQGGEFRLDRGAGVGGQPGERTARNATLSAFDISPAEVTASGGEYSVGYESFFPGTGYVTLFESFGPSGSAGNPNPYQLPSGPLAEVNATNGTDGHGSDINAWNGTGWAFDPEYPGETRLARDPDREGIWRWPVTTSADGLNSSIDSVARVNRTAYGIQQFPSVGVEPDGDAIFVWSGYGQDDPHGVFARRYDKLCDTVGPLATEVRLDDDDHTLLTTRPTHARPWSIVVVLDELMFTHEGWAEDGTGDPWDHTKDPDSVENPANWVVSRNGVPIHNLQPGENNPIVDVNPIVRVEFTLNPETNKYEAKLVFDDPLAAGSYEVTALNPIPDTRDAGGNVTRGQSGLRDALGNALALLPDAITGGTTEPNGSPVALQFVLESGDDTVIDRGWTHPETPGAVAVDADGDYVVVWTMPVWSASDGNTYDRIMVEMFDADGTSVDQFAVTPPNDASCDGFDNVHQRFGSVAIDEDGDFVVTWTQYDTEHDANIYARRYAANGTPLESPRGDDGPFQVNTYTTNNQKWSNVAMDVDGDFIITWSSYSQEDDNQLGSGYGVYARRYDFFGQPLAPEFQVNVTTEGNQFHSSVAMDAAGGFAVVWTSDQNGEGTDIITRAFWPDGAPQPLASRGPFGYLFGEVLVNGSTAGNQDYADIAMTPDGSSYTVTWTGPDGSGSGVFVTQVSRETDPTAPGRFTFRDNTRQFFPPSAGAFQSAPINVGQSFSVTDLDVQINIDHPRVSDLIITLQHVDTGTEVLLAERRPGGTGSPRDGANYSGTVFDDEAPTDITSGTAVPPYSARFVPEDGLDAFDGELSDGDWVLLINDVRTGPFDTVFPFGPLSAYLDGWWIDIEKGVSVADEQRVNQTTAGNQRYSSVAVDDSGDIVVTWCGPGNLQHQEDLSENGVFYRTFPAGLNMAGAGSETRVNDDTDGNQWIPSVDMDDDGNFIIVWTGEDPEPTSVYQFSSTNDVQRDDTTGPIVTDVLDPNGNRILEGSVVDPSCDVTELTVVFSEQLSTREGDNGLDSVFNPNNWTLERNGAEIVDGVVSIDKFWRNPATRKYEAVITLDGDSLSDYVSPLPEGNYVLTVWDKIHDDYAWDSVIHEDVYFLGNALDGDFDGVPTPAYRIGFSVVDAPTYGAEFRINDEDDRGFEQRFSAGRGTGLGVEETTRSVAVDHDGDFVVAWTSYGQDYFAEPEGAGVYFRLFDRENNSVGNIISDTLVNEGHEQGDQRNAGVAMDADGDFIIVWEEYREDEDGNLVGDIWARRYNSVGEPLLTDSNHDGLVNDDDDPSGIFRVNTHAEGFQWNPAVAMDEAGNFVIVWATSGQPFSYFNDVHAQIYNYRGEPVGSEFRVNEVNIPGTNAAPGGSIELNPTVAMDPDGNFVVAWDQLVQQDDGVTLDTVVVARLFDSLGNPNGTSPNTFQVNVGDDNFYRDGEHDPAEPAGGGSAWQREARNPQAAMDSQGNFIIAWEAYQDNDLDDLSGPESYGVYFRRFQPDGTPDPTMADQDHQANLVMTVADATAPTPANNNNLFAFGQVNPSVAMDADGDYAVVWNGNGAVPHPLGPGSGVTVTGHDVEGVWIRNFHADDGAATPEFVTVQTRVNMTSAGIQQFPSIGMEPDGDKIVVWNGWGVGDTMGIFARRYDEPTDTAGPRMTELRLDDDEHTRLDSTEPVEASPWSVVVVLDELMWTHEGWQEDGSGDAWDHSKDPDSVENPANWVVSRNGVDIHNLQPGQGLPIAEINPIVRVEYTLNPETNKYEAKLLFDDPLPAGTYEVTGLNPVPDTRDFFGNITLGRSGLRDARGNPLALLPSDATGVGTEPDGAPMRMRFWLRSGEDVRIDRGWTHPQTPGAVAVDADGDQVVVWTKPIFSASDGNTYDRIVVELFDADGTSFDRFAVTPPNDTHCDGFENVHQRFGSVAVDEDGDFVVT